jgi:hypothetical protein
MDLKKLMWEGPAPIVPPNMGHRVNFAWCPEDWRRFELSVRAAYPNVFFYEGLLNSEESGEAEPPLTRIERLDRSRRGRTIRMLFPDPTWEPKWIRRVDGSGNPYWAFDQYWSPIIWMGSPTAESYEDRWWPRDGNPPVVAWPAQSIQSSYRRQFEHEATCQAKILNLARKIGRRMVKIRWESLADYRAGIGRVDPYFRSSEAHYVSDGVIDWYRQDRKRALFLNVLPQLGMAFSRMPPEDVPDHFWGDVKKPKWVLEAIEKYRR